VKVLSGGELQRFAISVVVVQKADVYMFDEPSSYLDVKQRLKVRAEYAVLCCAVLCCAVLCCAVLCCAVLCCAVLCCAVL
jgi:translation initiation factor RLI1